MELAYIGLLIFVASMLGTVTAFGTSTIMIPVLLLFYPLPETLLFVGIMHWFGNLWRFFIFKQKINWPLVMAFGIPGFLAAILGAMLSLKISEEVLANVLGIFLIAYVVFLYFRPSFKLPQNNSTYTMGGTISGFLAGIFGVGGGVTRGSWLAAYNLPKYNYIFLASVIGFFIDSARVGTYIFGGIGLSPLFFWGLILFIPLSYIGVRVGHTIVDQIPQGQFRSAIAVFLLAIAVQLILFLG